MIDADNENNYGLPAEQQRRSPDNDLVIQRKEQLHTENLHLADSLIAGKISREQFAKLQTEKDLRLESQAEYDSLTGVLNRRGFYSSFDEKISGFRRSLHVLKEQGLTGTPGCLVALDLDSFGSVNKVYGQDAGDSVLVQVATILVKGVRPEDPVARFGGEEFVIFLAGAKLADAGRVVERIRTTISEQATTGSSLFKQTATFGIVQFPDDLTEAHISDPRNRGDLFKKAYGGATEAMKFAKENGKDRIAVKNPDGKVEVINPNSY